MVPHISPTCLSFIAQGTFGNSPTDRGVDDHKQYQEKTYLTPKPLSEMSNFSDLATCQDRSGDFYLSSVTGALRTRLPWAETKVRNYFEYIV